MSQENRRVNEIISAWSTFVAALVALSAILLQIRSGAIQRNETQINVRNLIYFILDPIPLRYSLTKGSTDVEKKWGVQEEGLLVELMGVYPKLTVLHPSEVKTVTDLIYILEGIKTRGVFNISSFHLVNVQIWNIYVAMQRAIQDYDWMKGSTEGSVNIK